MVGITEDLADFADLGDAFLEANNDATFIPVAQGDEVLPEEILVKLARRRVNRYGAIDLDEMDAYLGSFPVQMPFEIFLRIGPALGEVVLDAVGLDRIDNSPKLTLAVSKLDELLGYFPRFLFTRPDGSAVKRAFKSHCLGEPVSVLHVFGALFSIVEVCSAESLHAFLGNPIPVR